MPVFQRELCDLAEAQCKLRYARGMYRLLTTESLPPEMEELKKKQAHWLEIIRILEYVIRGKISRVGGVYPCHAACAEERGLTPVADDRAPKPSRLGAGGGRG